MGHFARNTRSAKRAKWIWIIVKCFEKMGNVRKIATALWAKLKMDNRARTNKTEKKCGQSGSEGENSLWLIIRVFIYTFACPLMAFALTWIGLGRWASSYCLSWWFQLLVCAELTLMPISTCKELSVTFIIIRNLIAICGITKAFREDIWGRQVSLACDLRV